MREFQAVLLRSYSKTSIQQRCLFGSFRKSWDHPHRAILPSFPTSKYEDGVEKVSSAK
jgi:hypothetical protein